MDIYERTKKCFKERLNECVIDGRMSAAKKLSDGRNIDCDYENLGQFEKDALEERGYNLPKNYKIYITGKQLAEAAGCSASMISSYLTGEKIPIIDKFCALADALDVSYEYLLNPDCIAWGRDNAYISREIGLTESTINTIRNEKYEGLTNIWSWLINNMIESTEVRKLNRLLCEYRSVYHTQPSAEKRTMAAQSLRTAFMYDGTPAIMLSTEDTCDFLLNQLAETFKSIIRQAMNKPVNPPSPNTGTPSDN